MPTCEIQWIDSQGNLTPDTRDAVAVVQCTFDDGRRSEGYHICLRHLDRARQFVNWRVTYAAPEAPAWAKREARHYQLDARGEIE